MNTVINILTSKDTWIVILMFVLAWFLFAGIENLMTTKDTLVPLLGAIPSILIWYFYFVRKTNK
jgi:hypothetical protein